MMTMAIWWHLINVNSVSRVGFTHHFDENFFKRCVLRTLLNLKNDTVEIFNGALSFVQ